MYRELKIQSDKKILIVSPHPDDETIGAGGILALYGSQCDVVLLTDGRFGNPNTTKYSEEDIVDLRHDEFVEVMDYFHVNSYECLNIHDTKVSKGKKEFRRINFPGYDYVFVPNRSEDHVDHYATYKIVKRILTRKRMRSKIFEYEVWSPISNPNYYVNLNTLINSKLEAIKLYRSQLSCLNYEQMITGLNSYRGIRVKLSYCEAYFSPDLRFREKLDKICGFVMRKIKFWR